MLKYSFFTQISDVILQNFIEMAIYKSLQLKYYLFISMQMQKSFNFITNTKLELFIFDIIYQY